MRSDVKTGLFAGIVIAVAGVVYFAVHKKQASAPLPDLPVVHQPAGSDQNAKPEQPDTSGNTVFSGGNSTGKKNLVSPDSQGPAEQDKPNQQGNHPGDNPVVKFTDKPDNKAGSNIGDNVKTNTGQSPPATGTNKLSPDTAGASGNKGLVDANKANAGTGGQVVPVEPAVPKERYYVVVKGDTLYNIAESYYGQGKYGNIIYQANKNIIKNPNVLKPGWKLRIPYPSEISKQQH